MSLRLSSSEDMPAFDRLDPRLQRWIWQQGWPALRPIQADAIPPVLARDCDVVISAPTAGGKTEAAFLPILSDLAQFDSAALRCLCVSPLRALINDQARRLTSMADSLDLRVQPWHGDVTAGRSTFWKRPAHVLITTPESLEAMLMRRGEQFGLLARDLRYLVVDELHAFFGSERGAQLCSLMQRVERLAGQVLPRIALSATLGDPGLAGQFLRPNGGHPVRTLATSASGGEIRLQVRAINQRRIGDEASASMQTAAEQVSTLLAQLARLPVDAAETAHTSAWAGAKSDCEDAPADRYTSALGEVADHLFSRLRGASHLVFANARGQVELLADQLRERAEAKRLPNEFFPHHGALSRDLRLSVEERLRDGKLPTTAVCTSTLEMGIDIGDVTSVAQIGPAPSVSTLKQRIGRSGRRAGQAQILRQYVVLPALDVRSHPVDWLRLPLIQAIATVELMLQGRFEPPTKSDLHLSTLVQQILSLIVQSGGGSTAVRLYESLCQFGAFRNVDRGLFVAVLRALAASKVIEQVADGTLLPGSTGERLIDHYSFYATFFTPEEYQLLCDGKRLGTLPVVNPLAPDQLLLFAGRRWRVAAIDVQERTVTLTPARGGRPPVFGGAAAGVHRIVHQKMKELLLSQETPIYLDAAAQQALVDARESYSLFGFDQSPVLPADGAILLAHWSGTRIGGTLALWLQSLGADAASAGPFVELNGVSREKAIDLLQRAQAFPPESAEALARHVAVLEQNKFDAYLSEEVLTKGYAGANIDLPGAVGVVQTILED